jgi:NodT family efflux transporter outer membrane factor (OMF) lipoprotein
VPVSLAGTFGFMYLAGFSLDNLSLMALTVATGFVVDDAIVVLENISRHLERGKSVLQASLDGAREIGFTVISISLSLIAVFIPILLMGGIVGRLFREFSIVLSVAILISMLISLTTTPMMCAALLKPRSRPTRRSLVTRLLTWLNRALLAGYRRSLAWALRWQPLVLVALAGVIALNIELYQTIPKGFFPQQDTGRIVGFIRADQATSFQAMQQRLERFLEIVRADPAIETVTGFTGGGSRNSAQMFMALKPLAERRESASQVVARLRLKLAREPGATLFMVPVQDIRVGGRQASSQYQFTVQADEIEELRAWSGPIRQAMMRLPEIVDVDSDVQDRGRQTTLVLDRDAIARLGLSVRAIDATLNNAFAQRQIGVIYNPLNQYRIVLELAPEFLQGPETLRSLQFVSSTGKLIPLSDFARIEETAAPLSVAHQSGTPATTVSFNLAPGVALSQASDAIRNALAEIGTPVSIRGSFQGTAGAFTRSLESQPLLILAALITIYLVLGILYESLVHPLTILSTLPSAGVGALLALKLFETEFSVIAMIAVILLIGIVKKNAIMMIDFAIDRQRRTGIGAGAAIYAAARIRLRPILMTTIAAILGAIPLAMGTGDGAELRQPLGIAIVGGLVLSQLLTLYTTPVVYVLIDRLRTAVIGLVHRIGPGHGESMLRRPVQERSGVATRSLTVALIGLAALLASACSTLPAYDRPAIDLPETFREQALFAPARPGQPIPERWWQVFGDQTLDQLQSTLEQGNQNLAAAQAQYRIALAALRASEASLSVPLNLNLSATQSLAATASRSTTSLTPSISTSWEIDLWGRVGQAVSGAQAQAQASGFDLAAVRLSLQATLTQTYFALRTAELQAGLLANAVQANQRLLQLTEDRYRAGVVSAADVAQAQTQLKSAEAQLEEARASRRLLEHALATLVGRPGSSLIAAEKPMLPDAPEVPEILPSQLLERRPDIAAAERRVAAANARLGIARSAFFPTLNLSANAGLRGSDLGELLSSPNLFWSLGPGLASALLDGGLRKAGVESALASLDQTSAQYRQLVLIALQEVEDSLVQVATLRRQSALQAESLVAARRALELVLDQYRAGTVSFLNVISAQTTALTIERSLVDLRNRQLAATNQLLKQLAGDWNARSPAITPPRRPGVTQP